MIGSYEKSISQIKTTEQFKRGSKSKKFIYNFFIYVSSNFIFI